MPQLELPSCAKLIMVHGSCVVSLTISSRVMVRALPLVCVGSTTAKLDALYKFKERAVGRCPPLPQLSQPFLLSPLQALSIGETSVMMETVAK